MARNRVSYRCSECGADHVKWAGRCDACGSWATLAELAEAEAGPRASGWTEGRARPFSEVDDTDSPPVATGVGELDRALGGGLVAGSVTLLGGEPGIGKSTLLLQLASAVSRDSRRVLYVSAEESAAQLGRRAGRLGLELDEVFVHCETSVLQVISEIERLRPELVLVDSIQTVATPEAASVPGSVAQVRACAQALVEVAKGRATTTILVGHVTKDGSLAGPRTLEHLVDTVLTFEGDRHQRLRFLRAVKHRFGATGEPGVMEMTGSGLVGVPDPSGLFLADRRPGAPGSAVAPVLEGHRPLMVEVQALVVPARSGVPRRAAQGIDSGRLSLLLAVLERRCGLDVLGSEAYVSVVGGVRVSEPGADLATALAIASSVKDSALRSDLVACGEVGLSGEVRQVAQLERRLDEAARLGYRRAIVPASFDGTGSSMELLHAGTVSDAIGLALAPAVPVAA